MYGPIVSVLLMGMLPISGLERQSSLAGDITIAAPLRSAEQRERFASLDAVLTASGAIIVDLDSGQTIYERAAETARPMASLTKLMTALIIVENHDLDEWVDVPANIEQTIGNVANLPPGQRFTVGDLLSALLVMSANDAGVALAHYHSGSVDAFVEEMNARAKTLGLQSTTYENPVGFDAKWQDSSPRDLAWLTMYVMRQPEIAKRMGMQSGEIRSATGESIALTNTHAMLKSGTPIIAGKTGTTDAAGQCLLSIVEANDHRYVVVLLHSQNRYEDMQKVLSILD